MADLGIEYIDGRRYTRMYRALYQPILVLGGERDLVIMTAILCAGPAFNSLKLVNIVTSGVVWVIAIAGIRMMAKADPQLSAVYRRYLRYQIYYPAASRPGGCR